MQLPRDATTKVNKNPAATVNHRRHTSTENISNISAKIM